MSILFTRLTRHYAFGLVCTFLGAWLTDITDSMLPLALGASALVLATVPLVRAIWGKKPSRDVRRK